MEFKKLNQAVKLPVLGLGTWGIDGKIEPDRTNDKEDILKSDNYVQES